MGRGGREGGSLDVDRALLTIANFLKGASPTFRRTFCSSMLPPPPTTRDHLDPSTDKRRLGRELTRERRENLETCDGATYRRATCDLRRPPRPSYSASLHDEGHSRELRDNAGASTGYVVLYYYYYCYYSEGRNISWRARARDTERKRTRKTEVVRGRERERREKHDYTMLADD